MFSPSKTPQPLRIAVTDGATSVPTSGGDVLVAVQGVADSGPLKVRARARPPPPPPPPWWSPLTL